MSLLSVDEARALVETVLSDAELQDVIDRVEADITESLGDSYEGLAGADLTETHAGYTQNIFLNRKIGSVTTVTEYDSLESSSSGRVLTEGTHFHVWAKEARLQRFGAWGAKVVIEYQPLDQDKKWKTAISDLLKLTIARSPLMSESVGGEMSYQRPENWELERERILRRLRFTAI